MDNKEIKVLPVLVLRGRTMFPNISFSCDVGRKMSLYAVEKAVTTNTELFVCTQKNSLDDNPAASELYTTGVICRLVKLNGIGEKNVRLQIEGLYRGKTAEFKDDDGLFSAEVMRVDDIAPAPIEERAYHSVAREKLNEYAKIAPKISSDLVETLLGVENPSEFVNILAFNLNIKESDKQAVLEEVMLTKRLELISSQLNSLAVNAQLEKEIADRVKESVEKNQKEYYLREQLKAIHGELGDDEAEVSELREKILAKKMPEECEKKVLKELDRMSRMPSSSPDYTVLRTYVDWIIDLPFTNSSTDRESLDDAIKILDEDHFGLEKVKERIVEYLAVMKLTGKVGGSILCFVGPPGVGKTSVATSIARALDRKFVRISLGGVKDEAEIRGHRKTYIGAMPGRIIYGLKDAGVNNPVFLLDEIDKLSSDMRGDPASALLEVLDPEQNKTFRDRYIEIPFDLSNVLFITTANTLETIPAPLLDRMEVISLDGYTLEEKEEIAKRYLIPKRIKMNGLTEDKIEFTSDAVTEIIKGYTMEAGVRSLERNIDSVVRKIATKLAKEGKLKKQKITAKTIPSYLGGARFSDDSEKREDEVGAATGLAWTAYGGTTLTIEVSLINGGKGEILLTGKLGDVMKESARAALSYIRANAQKYNIDEEIFTTHDLHVHVPEGATPKDGPSAGITLATAILSALTERKVRSDIAMTGEITLRGKVLAIGGLKEKALAAFRAGITDIIIPFANKKDIEDVPKNIAKKINFIPVKTAEEVFALAIKDLKH